MSAVDIDHIGNIGLDIMRYYRAIVYIY